MARRMKSRVTSAAGDTGTTRALSGAQLLKCDTVIECTGCVDTLRAHLAELRLLIIASDRVDRDALADFLMWLLHLTFLIGTEVNDPECVHPEYRQQNLDPTHLLAVEAEQQRLESAINFPRAFIVSASNFLAARADICATVARSLERQVVALKQEVPSFDSTHLLPLVNRLSDYLYVLGRHLEDGRHLQVDYKVLTRHSDIESA